MRKPTSIRLTEEDMKDLEKCQQVFGGLSQSDTVKVLIRMYLDKVPVFPEKYRKRK